MERKILIILVLFMLKIVKSQDLTPADVCTQDRTKSSFCNNAQSCDATGIVLCYGNDIGVDIACSSDKPYCTTSSDGDYCIASNPCEDNTASDKPPFQCTGTGYYPNPYDCTSYYFCSMNNDRTSYISNLNNCPSANVFSPTAANYCTRRNTIFNNCQTVSCGNTTEPKYVQVLYGFNRQYYALCMPGTTPQNPSVLIFVCPSSSTPDFNSYPAKCAYSCWRAGFFPNDLDNTKYFDCFWNSNLRLESVERRCASGSIFNPNRSECVVQMRSLSQVVDSSK